MAETYKVSEIFGPTIQGEGPQVGLVTWFVRFGGCDYRCEWCDSKYSVDPYLVGKLPSLTTDEILAHLPEGVIWVTLSGGNPVIWDLDPLVRRLHDQRKLVAVETQGTIFRPWLEMCDSIVVSPKPPSSGMKTSLRRLSDFLSHLTTVSGNIALKVVVFNDDDLEFARMIHSRYPFYPFYISTGTYTGVQLFSSRSTADTTKTILERTRWIIDKVRRDPLLHDIHVLPQVHVLLWGSRRGV